MKPFEYVHASTVASALTHLGADWSVRLKAGGIDLVDELKEGLIAPQRVVSLRAIPGLDKVEAGPDGAVRLGALVTLAGLAEAKALQAPALRAIAEAAAASATPQIRNVATLGGNLCQRPRCWYYRGAEFPCLKKGGTRCFAQRGDNRYHAIFGNTTCAIVHPSAVGIALVALGAKVKLVRRGGEREVALEAFFVRPEQDPRRENVLGPGEILTAVTVPQPAAGTRSVFLKLKEKESFDWPMAEVAVSLALQGGRCQAARIVLGAAAPVPWRAEAAEKVLAGAPVTAAAAERAGQLAIQGATPMSHNAYKLELFKVLVARAIRAAAEVK